MRVYQVVISLPTALDTLKMYDGEYSTLFKEMYIDKLQVSRYLLYFKH
jgi:hypothetical protein